MRFQRQPVENPGGDGRKPGGDEPAGFFVAFRPSESENHYPCQVPDRHGRVSDAGGPQRS